MIQPTEVQPADIFCQPVYEIDKNTASAQRLVLTCWMLLDELKQCQDEVAQAIDYVHRTGVGEEQIYGVAYNPLAARLEKAHFNVSHILTLLWRGGLWTNGAVTEK